MKKLRVWTENAINDTEDFIYLKLQEEKGSEDFIDISLCCVDKKGNNLECGHILVLDGRLRIIYTVENINEEIPLKINIDNEAIVVPEYEMREKAKSMSLKSLVEHIKTCKEKKDSDCAVH